MRCRCWRRCGERYPARRDRLACRSAVRGRARSRRRADAASIIGRPGLLRAVGELRARALRRRRRSAGAAQVGVDGAPVRRAPRDRVRIGGAARGSGRVVLQRDRRGAGRRAHHPEESVGAAGARRDRAAARSSFHFACRRRRPRTPCRRMRPRAAIGRFALINPGAAWPNKRWAPDRFGALARHLRDRHQLPSLRAVGAGRSRARRSRGRRIGRRRRARAGDVAGRSAGAGVARRADGVGRHRADSPRRGARHADRRAVRSDVARAQRSVGSARRGRVARARRACAITSGSASAATSACASTRSRSTKSRRRSIAGWSGVAATGDERALAAQRRAAPRARIGLVMKWLARRRVALGFILGAVVLWLAQPTCDVARARRGVRADRRSAAHLGRRASREEPRGDALGAVSLHAASAVSGLVDHRAGDCRRVGERGGVALIVALYVAHRRFRPRFWRRRRTCARSSAATTTPTSRARRRRWQRRSASRARASIASTTRSPACSSALRCLPRKACFA